MKVIKHHGFIIFLLIAAIHLLAVLLAWEHIRFLTKPVLMPALGLAVFVNTTALKGKALVLTALFFSFLGDSFLLFDNKYPLFFIFGLVSFLITHILYIVYFLGTRQVQASLLKKNPWIVLLVIAYGFSLVYFLLPGLGELKIPVIVYATVICSMLLASIHICRSVASQPAVLHISDRYYVLSSPAGALFVAGALFFVLSDSLLAIAKFHSSFPFASFLIMLTYCAAQYFIAKGFVKADSVMQS